jgi:hypothetical protein
MKESAESYIKAVAIVDLDLAKKYPHGAYFHMSNNLVNYARMAMHERLVDEKNKGLYGWWNKEQCTIESLKALLDKAVKDGDMVSVMNFSAMMYVREIYDSFGCAEKAEGAQCMDQ